MHFSLSENAVFQNFDLSAVSSMRTGGRAAYALFPENKEMLRDAFFEAKESGLSVVLAGGTSNMLFPDDASRLCVIFTKRMTSPLTFDRTLVTAGCGVMLPYLSKEAAKRGLSGLEFACGIPGTVGGALFMNAGAYGGELKDVCRSVRALMPDGSVREFAGDGLFGYRTSVFQTNGAIILSAVFALFKGDEAAIREKMRELMQRRMASQPLELPSAGSTFKRPEGAYAGPLIEASGLKGKGFGGAQVSQKHAGFVVNTGGATARDVLDTIHMVQQTVKTDSGYTLEPEVRIW